MKKLTVWIAAALLLLTYSPVQSKAEAEKYPNSISSAETESVEVKALINRVNEINAMDKSAMSSSEKKELRKELRSIKRDVNEHSHGGAVYISGSLLLFIILLIIIF
ncbi:MAG: hypothetical protein AABY93_13420 [Bacteroidota bacterium]